MVKISPGAAYDTHLGGTTISQAILILLTRTDATVLGLTTHNEDLIFNDGDGSVTYVSFPGASRTAVETTYSPAVDNLDISTFFAVAGIEEADILNGLWDAADVKIYLVNHQDLTMGAWKIRRGRFGTLTLGDDLVAELQGMFRSFITEMVELTGPTCRAEFGDGPALNPRCKIDIVSTLWSASLAVLTRLPFDAGGLPGSEELIVRPTSFNDRWFEATTGGTTGGGEPSWDTTLGNSTTDNDITFKAIRARRINVAVDSVTNHMEFVVKSYSGDAPDAFLSGGFALFTSGNNNLVKIGVSSWVLSTLTVKLFQPLTQVLAVDDTLTLVSGCDRIRTTCVNTYDNILNFRGEPDLPGDDHIFRIPPPPPSG